MKKTLAEFIGANILHARKYRDYTQRKISQKCKLTQGYWGSIERGESIPSLETLTLMCHVLAIEFRDVLPPKLDEFVKD